SCTLWTQGKGEFQAGIVDAGEYRKLTILRWKSGSIDIAADAKDEREKKLGDDEHDTFHHCSRTFGKCEGRKDASHNGSSQRGETALDGCYRATYMPDAPAGKSEKMKRSNKVEFDLPLETLSWLKNRRIGGGGLWKRKDIRSSDIEREVSTYSTIGKERTSTLQKGGELMRDNAHSADVTQAPVDPITECRRRHAEDACKEDGGAQASSMYVPRPNAQAAAHHHPCRGRKRHNALKPRSPCRISEKDRKTEAAGVGDDESDRGMSFHPWMRKQRDYVTYFLVSVEEVYGGKEERAEGRRRERGREPLPWS
ncbi:hypothetical protein CVT26_001083, partial [Gymnopilus dilepis]